MLEISKSRAPMPTKNDVSPNHGRNLRRVEAYADAWDFLLLASLVSSQPVSGMKSNLHNLLYNTKYRGLYTLVVQAFTASTSPQSKNKPSGNSPVCLS